MQVLITNESEKTVSSRVRCIASKIEKQPIASISSTNRFLLALLRLSALFHDLGKASKAFQLKLKRGHGAEPVRHDLLSFLILAESIGLVYGDAESTPSSDEDWLTLLSSNPLVCTSAISDSTLLSEQSSWRCFVESALKSQNREKPGILLSAEALRSLNNRCPGLLVLLWLVLTHHRLAHNDSNSEYITPGRHLNFPCSESKTNIAPLDQCFSPADKLLPWKERKWLDSVAACAKSALAAYKEMGGPDPISGYALIRLAAHYLRPSLILADHIGSLLAEEGPAITEAFAGDAVYANTFSKAAIGDTLSTHLIKVQHFSRRIALLALKPQVFPTYTAEIPLFTTEDALPPQYDWQRKLQVTCEQARKNGPCFTAIIAETGSGKTIGGFRAAYALAKGSLRLTLALGLRSLTFQSAQSYTKDLGIPGEALTVAVGQHETLRLGELAKNVIQESSAPCRFGSESSGIAGEIEPAVLSGSTPCLDWLDGILSSEQANAYFGKKQLAMLAAPILACTTDHLVGAVTLLRGTDSKLFLRLTSSDLILDEIDCYSPSDLQNIGKLVYVAGLFNRNVICMSATLSPAIFEGLYNAWYEGRLQSAQLHENSPSGSLILASNTVSPQNHLFPNSTQAKGFWSSFVDKVCAVYANVAVTPKRRLVKFQDDRGAISVQEFFKEIVTELISLHHDNCTIDPESGKRVSIGCVRVNRTRSAWNFSEYLATRQTSTHPAEPRILFVSYHSKYPKHYLGALDFHIKSITDRKDPFQIYQNPILRNAIDSTCSEDVIIVVVTTTLVETGRDFDFDWCITEPLSERGCVQLAGRLRRHRPEPWQAINFVILSKPSHCFAEYSSKKPSSPWSQPGIEDQLPQGKRLTIANPLTASASSQKLFSGGLRLGSDRKISVLYAKDALPITLWSNRLDAEACLLNTRTYEEDRLGYLEHKIQYSHLAEPARTPNSLSTTSLTWYLSSLAPLNDSHSLATLFRGPGKHRELFVITPDKIKWYDPDTRELVICSKADAIISNVDPVNSLLPNIAVDAEKLAERFKHDLIIRSCELQTKHRSLTKLVFDPLLGIKSV